MDYLIIIIYFKKVYRNNIFFVVELIMQYDEVMCQ